MNNRDPIIQLPTPITWKLNGFGSAVNVSVVEATTETAKVVTSKSMLV